MSIPTVVFSKCVSILWSHRDGNFHFIWRNAVQSVVGKFTASTYYYLTKFMIIYWFSKPVFSSELQVSLISHGVALTVILTLFFNRFVKWKGLGVHRIMMINQYLSPRGEGRHQRTYLLSKFC